MLVLNRIESPPPLPKPYGLAIGSFDGFHLGHQKLIKRLREVIGPKGSIAVITFTNHPKDVLPHQEPQHPIFTTEQKLKHLENAGINLVYLLEFTPALASLSYSLFIDTLRQVYPFDYLLLGGSDTLGHNREGTPEKITQLGIEQGFLVEYLSKLSVEGEEISSTLIRKYLKEGNLTKAKKLLGHDL